MINRMITMYELMRRIKNGNAPKKIEITGHIYEFDEDFQMYKTQEINEPYRTLLGGVKDDINLIENMFNKIVKILPEENDEWEDIEEFEITGCNVKIKIGDNETFISTESLILDYVLAKINQLIKNQKYLKEKLESKDE